MKQLIALFLLLLACCSAQADALDPFSPDLNSSTGGVQDKAGSIENLAGVWGQIAADPPQSFVGFMQEYKANAGGPISSAMGIRAFKLTSGLMAGFGGMMLLIFTGAAACEGLSKGELNLLSIGGKMLLGIIVIFHPEFVYAAGRAIQTSGQQIALSALAAGKDSAIGKAIQSADLGKLSAGTIETQAAEQAKAAIAGYLFNNPERARAGVSAFNSQNKAGLRVEPAAQNDAQATNQRAAEALNLLGLALAKDSRYQDKLTLLREQFSADMKAASGDSLKQDQLEKQFLQDASQAASEVAEKLYGIGADDKLWDATVGKIPVGAKGVAEWMAKGVASILVPLAIWILTKGAALILELACVIVVLTYPFFLWGGTSRTFTGSLRTYFATSLAPAVGVILLCILEGVMAMIAQVGGGTISAVQGNFWGNLIGGGGMQLGFAIGFCILWIVGVVLCIWLTPKITASLMAGGSILGSLAGGVLAAGVGAGMTAIGLSTMALGGVGGIGGMAALKGTAGKGLADAATSGTATLANGTAGVLAGGGSAGNSAAPGVGISANTPVATAFSQNSAGPDNAGDPGLTGRVNTRLNAQEKASPEQSAMEKRQQEQQLAQAEDAAEGGSMQDQVRAALLRRNLEKNSGITSGGSARTGQAGGKASNTPQSGRPGSGGTSAKTAASPASGENNAAPGQKQAPPNKSLLGSRGTVTSATGQVGKAPKTLLQKVQSESMNAANSAYRYAASELADDEMSQGLKKGVASARSITTAARQMSAPQKQQIQAKPATKVAGTAQPQVNQQNGEVAQFSSKTGQAGNSPDDLRKFSRIRA